MFSRFCCIHFHRLFPPCASFLGLRPVVVWGARIAASTPNARSLHPTRTLLFHLLFFSQPSLFFIRLVSSFLLRALPFFSFNTPIGSFHRSNASSATYHPKCLRRRPPPARLSPESRERRRVCIIRRLLSSHPGHPG